MERCYQGIDSVNMRLDERGDRIIIHEKHYAKMHTFIFSYSFSIFQIYGFAKVVNSSEVGLISFPC